MPASLNAQVAAIDTVRGALLELCTHVCTYMIFLFLYQIVFFVRFWHFISRFLHERAFSGSSEWLLAQWSAMSTFFTEQFFFSTGFAF